MGFLLFSFRTDNKKPATIDVAGLERFAFIDRYQIVEARTLLPLWLHMHIRTEETFL